MLLIEGWIKLGAGEFARVKDAACAMVAATNQEEGCIHYSFAQDIGDPDLIRISERWRDDAALAAHNSSAHMADFGQTLGTVKREGADLWLYSAEAVRKLM